MKNPALLKLLKLIKKYWLTLSVSILLSALALIIQLYIPLELGESIDYIISVNNVDLIKILAILKRAFILIIVSALLSYIASLINNHISFKVVEDLRKKAMARIQILPLSYLDSHASGSITSRIIVDCEQIADGLLLGFSNLFNGIITIFVTLYFMARKDFSITIMVVILTPLSFFVSRFIASRSYQLFSMQNESRGRLSGMVNEFINNEKILKAFGYESRASRRFDEINKELCSYSKMAVFYSSLTNPSTRAVNNIIYAFVVLVGSFKIMSSTLSVGGLTVLLSYCSQYSKPFNDISSVVTEFQNSLSCAKRVFELIEEEAQSKDGDSVLKVDKGDIDIDGVYFSYDKKQKLIEDFNIKVRSGETVAIVGPTGCGKTTLINLLMRFYDTDKGSIVIDGKDIKDSTRRSLRDAYGMVLQDTWIRNDTVRNNICLSGDADDEEIMEAARKAHAYDFIRRMDKGLDTIIDESYLSQGQKQLLCIARVMLKKPEILILDEATSNIDTRTEIFIQKAFNELMEGHTAFIVAHRLSTIKNADKIIVMKDGHIIEQGTHKELLKKKGFYNELYNSQFAKISESI